MLLLCMRAILFFRLVFFPLFENSVIPSTWSEEVAEECSALFRAKLQEVPRVISDCISRPYGSVNKYVRYATVLKHFRGTRYILKRLLPRS